MLLATRLPSKSLTRIGKFSKLFGAPSSFKLFDELPTQMQNDTENEYTHQEMSLVVSASRKAPSVREVSRHRNPSREFPLFTSALMLDFN